MSSKSQINTFIFDCFEVLCSPVISVWYEKNVINQGYTDTDFLRILKRYDLGELSENDLLDHFLAYEWINSPRESIRDDIDSHFTFNEELGSMIKKLKQQGFKTVLLSNGNEDLFSRTIYKKYPEFESLFDEIVISSVVKMIKPDPEIFHYTLQKISSKPSEALFIDDRKENVEAAMNLGIAGHVYIDNNTFLSSLKENGVDLGQ